MKILNDYKTYVLRCYDENNNLVKYLEHDEITYFSITGIFYIVKNEFVDEKTFRRRVLK